MTTIEPPFFLPLPGEYVVVQINPSEMVKPLANDDVEVAFSKIRPLRKYCAVVYKVRDPSCATGRNSVI